MDRDLEFIQEARNLLQAAHEAWLKFENFTEEQVERVLLEILKATFPCLVQRAGYRDFNVAIGAGCVMHIRYMIGVGVSLDAIRCSILPWELPFWLCRERSIGDPHETRSVIL